MYTRTCDCAHYACSHGSCATNLCLRKQDAIWTSGAHVTFRCLLLLIYDMIRTLPRCYLEGSSVIVENIQCVYLKAPIRGRRGVHILLTTFFDTANHGRPLILLINYACRSCQSGSKLTPAPYEKAQRLRKRYICKRSAHPGS